MLKPAALTADDMCAGACFFSLRLRQARWLQQEQWSSPAQSCSVARYAGHRKWAFLRKVDWPSDVLGRQCRVCLGILVAGQSTVVRDVEEYLLLCTASHHIGVCVFRSNQDVTFRGVCAVVAKTDTVTV